jgi:ubiquinone/menaquinone biosynthesis C-methylase UbiE
MTLEAYFDERADVWDETVAEKDSAKLSAMAARLGLKPGDTVLDVGSGTGVLVPYLLSQLGSSGTLVGLDLARGMLRKAADKGFGPRVSLLQADIRLAPLRSGACDAVVCYSSFPHFRDKPAALWELHRVLRPGGALAIAHTSGREHINARHARVPMLKNDRLQDEPEMRRMLVGAGFADIAVEDRPDSYLVTARKPASPVRG